MDVSYGSGFSRGFGVDDSSALPPDRHHVEMMTYRVMHLSGQKQKSSLTPDPVGCVCPVAARTVGWLHISPNHKGILLAFSRRHHTLTAVVILGNLDE